MSAVARPNAAGGHPSGDPLGYPLDDPLDDPRLGAIPEFIRIRVVEVADAVEAAGRRPTPDLVARVLEELRCGAVAPEGLEAALMLRWRVLADEIDPEDPAALQAHLDLAPVAHHPRCHYLAGLIAGLQIGAAWRGRP